MNFLRLSIVLLCITLGGKSLEAAPWVDTSDLYLRADIQALADAGVITVPVNTYPLMWAGIGADLAKAEPALLSAGLVDAFARVNFYYRQAIANKGNKSLKFTAATDAARFQHFGSDYREKAEAIASYEFLGSRFAYKLSTSAHYEAQDDKKLRFDDSYLAMIWGNWIFSAGTIGQWWGPGFDSGLIKSTNARPMPSVAVSRNNPQAFETPWLSWVGPWTLTAGFSLMEEERYAPRALLWNFRGTMRPFKQLEIGFSWTTQLCGEGQECDAKIIAKALTGQRDCRNDTGAGCSSYGNQLAGFDIRYAETWYDIPVGVYLEKTCEDAKGTSPWELADCGYLWGLDSRLEFDDQQYKLFLEYTDTLAACGTNDDVFNCFYEHSTYRSGSRYYGRALGSTYDSDAKVIVLGVIGQFANSRGFSSVLRYAQLNEDGVNTGNVWAPQPPKEDLMQLELSYRLPLWRGMMSVGGTISRSEFVEDESDSDATLFGSYHYKF